MTEEHSPLVRQAKSFAEEILINQLPEEIQYHTVEHTREVVEAVEEIASNSGVDEEDLEILLISAWFHDLGYRNKTKGHEEEGARLAESFLLKNDYDPQKIDQVKACIMATQMPQNPSNQLEQIICDADLLHLAKDSYWDKSMLLHKEMQALKGSEISEEVWGQGNKNFIESHSFFTTYARTKYEDKVRTNLEKVNDFLIEQHEGDEKHDKLKKRVKKLKKKVKSAKKQKTKRGIETMFRLTSKNHIELSAMADTKANIMISVNSIILSVLVSVLFRKLEEYPHYIVPAIIMTVVCLSTIVFSILATRPNVSKGVFTEEDVLSRRTNLLFFGNFHGMAMKEYEWGMKEMMNDADYLYTSLIRDIYFLGVVLGKKYRLLHVSYTIFLFGFVIAILSFAIAEIFFRSPYPY